MNYITYAHLTDVHGGVPITVNGRIAFYVRAELVNYNAQPCPKYGETVLAVTPRWFEPFVLGGVYRGEDHAPVMLCKVTSGTDNFILMGGAGCVHRNFTEVMTRDEIQEYIAYHNLKYQGDIGKQFLELLADCREE